MSDLLIFGMVFYVFQFYCSVFLVYCICWGGEGYFPPLWNFYCEDTIWVKFKMFKEKILNVSLESLCVYVRYLVELRTFEFLHFFS